VAPANVRVSSPAVIAEAGALLRAGGLVVFPTETVYGLGANALDERAVARIFAVKDRPRFNPLIVHLLDRAQADAFVAFHPVAAKLADRFWPGGLTLALPRRQPSPLALLVSAGLDTVAVRAPAHPIARDLIGAAGVPIAAPSANRSGRISPTTAADAAEEMGDALPLVVDGGPCPIGLESTVVGFDGERAVLLRAGAITRADIEAITGPLEAPSGRVEAPGMLASHYAPRAQLRLNARVAGPGEVLLAFGPDAPPAVVNLSAGADLAEAAANLFTMLRALDRAGPETIAVMPIPDTGLGEAINDRLARAAAPRDEGP
jgi:L-threonylcarbamoyladenylate synthase